MKFAESVSGHDCIRVDGNWFRAHSDKEWYVRDPIPGEPFGAGDTPETIPCVKVIVFKLFKGVYTRKPLRKTLERDGQNNWVLFWVDRDPERADEALKRFREEVMGPRKAS